MNATYLVLVLVALLCGAASDAGDGHKPNPPGAIAVLICDPGPGTIGAPIAADRP